MEDRDSKKFKAMLKAKGYPRLKVKKEGRKMNESLYCKCGVELAVGEDDTCKWCKDDTYLTDGCHRLKHQEKSDGGGSLKYLRPQRPAVGFNHSKPRHIL